ncbi:MAG: hypothetical protein D6756_03940 [Cyanobacteria bacterium J083]|nr:MAG: hypothetical protein D6756_03940 [Cyanobacteria bacterium J083]
MQIPTDISTYTKWSGILTLFFLVLTLISFGFKWGFRFRLVGVTSFMGVLTAGFFALNLGLLVPTKIPGAERYALVYDNGATQAVITLPPEKVSQEVIEPTLLQAASDLYSYGRSGVGGENQLTIRLRTVTHPQPGLSEIVYLGEIKRSLSNKQDEKMKVKVFRRNLAKVARYNRQKDKKA